MIVTESALVARINRKLAPFSQQLHKTRGGRMQFDCGDFYIRNTEINGIVDKHVDVEDLARELKVIRPWETVKESA